MTPPEASVHKAENAPQAVLCVSTLKTRAEFLALNRARRQVMPTLLVQGRDRRDGTSEVRVGFTCSKKVGNAVARNRAKRRLREAARQVLPNEARPGWDYALIGRAGVTGDCPFDELTRHLARALGKLHLSS
ncbi:MAG: ribonuclease P protein component [Pseudomonadota bacterium]